MSARLTPSLIQSIIELIPEEWLGNEPRFASVAQQRSAYVEYLLKRLETPRIFVEEASRAHALNV